MDASDVVVLEVGVVEFASRPLKGANPQRLRRSTISCLADLYLEAYRRFLTRRSSGREHSDTSWLDTFHLL